VVASVIVGLIVLAGVVGGWLAGTPRRLLALVLVGALAAAAFLVVLWGQPSFFENDETGSLWHEFAALACLVLWGTWSLGVAAGGLLRRARGSPSRPLP